MRQSWLRLKAKKVNKSIIMSDEMENGNDSQSVVKKTTIKDLKMDVLLKCFDYLDARSLKKSAEVCKE